jgi:signal transduction histidine kinase
VKEVDGLLRMQIEPARVPCSEGLLREVLWNLGENAVKYRRPEVPLKLEMIGQATHQHYELRVSDNGAGMSSNDARQAFDPLFRGEQTRSATPGTGLGLAIVKRIVEAGGGTVTVDSHAGQGTLFVVRLPLAAV